MSQIDGEDTSVKPSMRDSGETGSLPSENGTRDEADLEEARRKSFEAKLKLEEEKRKTLKYEDKLCRRRDLRKLIFDNISPKNLIIMLVGLAVLAALFVLVIKPYCIDPQPETEYLTSTQLEKVVCVNKLSTAEYVYNGIADVDDENGNIKQHIKYDAKVRAGVDMTLIYFEIDEENKTVTPILPEITIDDPEIDHTSFDYLPSNPDMELKDIISACKKDAKDEVARQGEIYDTALANLKTAVEALTLPLVESYGCTIVWGDEGDAEEGQDASKSKTDGANDSSDTKDGKDAKEGEGNE